MIIKLLMRSAFNNGTFFNKIINKTKAQATSKKLSNQIFFTFLSLFLTYSIVTVDFLFLEKVSYLATIGAAALIAYIYLIQSIVESFAQAMINNALYQDPNKGETFNKIVSIGLIYLIIVASVLILTLYLTREVIIDFVKIKPESKAFAMEYITYMIPFLLIYSISQYYMYIIYAINSAFTNIIYIGLILIFTFIFNYIFHYFNLGVKGVALANGIAVLLLMPSYIMFCNKKRIRLSFSKLGNYYDRAYLGVKRMGFAAIVEKISHNFLQFFITIIVSHIGAEMLSAKAHAQNFVLFITTMSVAFGIILQITTAEKYAKGDILVMQKNYLNFLKYSIIISVIFNVILFIFIYSTINSISTNEIVKKYIIIVLLMAFIMEPARILSILSKAYLKGLQSANLAVFFNILWKIVITMPLCYLVLNYTNLGLVGILGAETITYLANFISLQGIIFYILWQYKKKLIITEDKISN